MWLCMGPSSLRTISLWPRINSRSFNFFICTRKKHSLIMLQRITVRINEVIIVKWLVILLETADSTSPLWRMGGSYFGGCYGSTPVPALLRCFTCQNLISSSSGTSLSVTVSWLTFSLRSLRLGMWKWASPHHSGDPFIGPWVVATEGIVFRCAVS